MEKKPTKIAALSLASVLAVSLALSPTAAFAKNDHGKEASVKEGSNNKKDKGVTSSTEDSSTKNNVDETSSTESDQQSGTDQEKKKGLYNALEKVKNTPAEETISNLIPGDKEIEAVADEIRKGHKEGKYQISSAGQLSVAPVMKDNRVFVPFRFIGEAFAMNVEYEPESGSVIVNDPTVSTDNNTSSQEPPSSSVTQTEGSTGTAQDPVIFAPSSSPTP